MDATITVLLLIMTNVTLVQKNNDNDNLYRGSFIIKSVALQVMGIAFHDLANYIFFFYKENAVNMKRHSVDKHIYIFPYQNKSENFM